MICCSIARQAPRTIISVTSNGACLSVELSSISVSTGDFFRNILLISKNGDSITAMNDPLIMVISTNGDVEGQPYPRWVLEGEEIPEIGGDR